MGLFIQSYSEADQYYLLTNYSAGVDSQAGLYYNVIDREQNNGNGEVILKNKLLFPNTTQKMTAVVNEVDNICWVIAHELKNNLFKIIKIDENGLDENIITQNIGLNHISSSDLIGAGRMDASLNGTTIAVTIPYYDPDNTGEYKSIVELLRFDPKTGILADPVQIFLDEKSFSATFSPNGELLYVRVKNKIYQYDLTICDIEEMIESKYVIDTKNTPSNPTLERGPNGLIYSTGIWESTLDAILNPNEVGAASNYTRDVVEVEGDALRGLPTVINSYFTGEYDDYCFIKDEEDRNYKINAPKSACFGDDIFLQIESEQGLDFEAEMIRPDFIQQLVTEPVGPNSSTNGIVDFNFKIVSEFSTWYKLNFSFRIMTEQGEADTVIVPIETANCCTPFIRNWRFNAWTGNGTCFPVDYKTDYYFSPDSNVSCVAEIKKPGELKSSTSANRNMGNFDKTPTTGRILVGDPLPNVEMRAWYQDYATKIGTRYRFMASVCNVEKIERPCEPKIDCGRSLDMWIGIKNRSQELVLNRVDDIKYEDDWILLSGEFTAQDNYSEFQVWTLGNSEDNDISYGFAIDFVDLELVEEYELTVSEDTTICIDDDFTPSNEFNGVLTNVEWSPTDGVSNPNILNPTFSPEESTNYTITLNDELGCEYIDSLFVEVDSCLVQCVPCLSYTLTDKIVRLGDEYCINGEFIPTCPDSSRKGNLSLFFEYDSGLMNFKSSSTTAEQIKIDDKHILKLNYRSSEYILDEPNSFQLCFTALLGGDSLAKLTVYEDINTIEEVCVSGKDSSIIKYEACILPYRNVKFLSETSFDIEKTDDEINILLSTEEEGTFRFVLIDINGSVVKDYNLTNTGNKYSNEIVVSWLLEDLAAGVYFVRMQTPGGEINTIKFVKP